MLPDTTSTAPNSPSVRAIVSVMPYMTAQRIEGSVTWKNERRRPAPSVRAACSCSVPTSSSTGTIERSTYGSETAMVASVMPSGEKSTMNADARERPTEPANARVREHEGDTEDDGRHRDGNVEGRVEGAPSEEVVARDEDRRPDADNRVHGHGDRRHFDRQQQRREGFGLGDL